MNKETLEWLENEITNKEMQVNSFRTYNSNALFAKRFIYDLKNDVKILNSIKKELIEKDKWENILSSEREKVFPIQEPILDDVEKEYLKAVLKPFKNKIISVKKCMSGSITCPNVYYVNGKKVVKTKEYLHIQLATDYFCLPMFEQGTMYKNMKVNIPYTLKELGIDYE